MSKVCTFMFQMDAARLLHLKMYDPEGVEGFEQKLRSSANYSQRLKSLYEETMEAVVTGKLKRHPAVQGVLAACMEKIRMWNNGCSTMRNRHRF